MSSASGRDRIRESIVEPTECYRYAVVCERGASRRTLAVLAEALAAIEECPTMSDVEGALRSTLDERRWCIYRGGHHVAVHARRWLGAVTEDRLLVIRYTEPWERTPHSPAARPAAKGYRPVRVLSEEGAPEGAMIVGPLGILFERGASAGRWWSRGRFVLREP
jgi:hypothetical protein